MATDWTTEELRASTRAYLWMLRSEQAGFRPKKAAVRRALLAGPLSTRTEGSIEYRFQNISAVLQNLGKAWISGYKPASQVGSNVEGQISAQIEDYYSGERHHQRVTFMVDRLPPETIRIAASKLAAGEPFAYAESIAYDATTDEGSRLAPKSVIGFSGVLHYGAPLLSEDFAGGEGTKAFEKLRNSGLIVAPKAPSEATPESQEFREKVRKRKRLGFDEIPQGQAKPKKVITTATAFVRDLAVVAFVESDAGGICESCNSEAPFQRSDGTPYLEVHHIQPLAEEGPDTVWNAAALCPNCHRECHYGENATMLRVELVAKIAKKRHNPLETNG